METARRLPLTRDVLAEAIERATPVQLDLMESWLVAEIASRERSKRVRLLKAAGFPNAKDIEGYDWSNLRMPADWGRAQLEALDFIDRCEDLVLYGPVGTGKTHLAVALGRLACMRAMPAGFFTATGLLMRLRRAKREDRLDTELRQIAKPGSRSSTSSATCRSTRRDPGSCSRSYRIPTRPGASSTPRTSSSPAGDACSATRTWPPR